jgi:hypothetical protein
MRDGEGLMELLKGEKLNQSLLKFTLLCSFNIRNLIVSLKHRPRNSGSIGCILKLKALSSCAYIQYNCFHGQRVGWGKKNCSRCLLMALVPNLIWFSKCN